MGHGSKTHETTVADLPETPFLNVEEAIEDFVYNCPEGKVVLPDDDIHTYDECGEQIYRFCDHTIAEHEEMEEAYKKHCEEKHNRFDLDNARCFDSYSLRCTEEMSLCNLSPVESIDVVDDKLVIQLYKSVKYINKIILEYVDAPVCPYCNEQPASDYLMDLDTYAEWFIDCEHNIGYSNESHDEIADIPEEFEDIDEIEQLLIEFFDNNDYGVDLEIRTHEHYWVNYFVDEKGDWKKKFIDWVLDQYSNDEDTIEQFQSIVVVQ